MGLTVKVMTEEGQELCDSYLLRLGGWTEARYFAEAPESRIVEFEDGELIMPSPVNVRHQQLVGFLTFLLRGYVRAKGLGEVLNGPAVVRLWPGLDYEPDIFVILGEQLRQFETQYFSGAPALVVEITSPGGRTYDLKHKAANYGRHGVREYWVVEPEEGRLYQHTLPAEAPAPYTVQDYASGRVESLVVPGFWIEVAWLWQDPLPLEPPLLEALLRAP
ncbi:MAG: Uma2 family endonuclease [candidate division NC10 bacterium]|nr:Uma2 family endonuclease [candidate division NC10 bacterium]